MKELELLNANAPCAAESMFEEASLVGATGTNFEKTQDPKVITYEEAMADPRSDRVEEGLKIEHDKMMKYKVWEEIHRSDIYRLD